MTINLHAGVDLVEIGRLQAVIQRHGKRFLERIYTPQELIDCVENTASLAARFATKEAVSKALGTGIGIISWQEMEVRRGQQGQPVLFLYGAALDLAHAHKISAWSLSLSHTHQYAIAMVVMVAQEDNFA